MSAVPQPKPIPMKPVESSHLAAAGHDAPTKTLQVEFRRSGDQYQYRGVEAGTYVSMLAAKSIGQYFNAHVKGRYQGIKLEKPKH